MVIKLDKKLNLFVPDAVSNFEDFKESFEYEVESISLKDVNTDEVRNRILAKRPDLSENISSFMPSSEELAAKGEEMKDIEIIGINSKGSKINKTISLNRLLSYDKDNTFDNVHLVNGKNWRLSISTITYDKDSKTVIFE